MMTSGRKKRLTNVFLGLWMENACWLFIGTDERVHFLLLTAPTGEVMIQCIDCLNITIELFVLVYSLVSISTTPFSMITHWRRNQTLNLKI